MGVQPTPKILHADPVLDGGLAHAHLQFRKPVADLIHPGVLMQNRQRSGDRFVQRLGGDLNGMVGSGEITATDQAVSEGHEIILSYSLFVRHRDYWPPDVSGGVRPSSLCLSEYPPVRAGPACRFPEGLGATPDKPTFRQVGGKW